MAGQNGRQVLHFNISGTKRLSGTCDGSLFFPPPSLYESRPNIRAQKSNVIDVGRGWGGCRKLGEGQQKKPQVRTTFGTEVIAIWKFGRNWAGLHRPRDNFRPKFQSQIPRVLSVPQTRALACWKGLWKGYVMDGLKYFLAQPPILFLQKTMNFAWKSA